MIIRPEEPQDIPSIYTVNLSAFDTPAEAELVNKLREAAHPVISLLAQENNETVGHIMFSPVTLSGYPDLKLMGLAPMAVKPAYQGKGTGTMLVRHGLESCHQMGIGAVVVLGHTWFYPRFGFTPAARFGIRSEYDVPDDVFMLMELSHGYLQGASGVIKYHHAFDEL